MKLRRSPRSRIPGAAVMALVLTLASCRGAGEPTAPSVQARGGNGLTVSSVVPDNSKRGVTLDVTVNGSGFDQGSAVRLERQGVPAGGITTNATTFVSPKKLTANITIAATADTGKYDVAVTTSGGRKGVGIELFLVEYELAELGIIGGTWSRAHAINDLGEVVGASCTSDCLATAFYWTESGGMVNLGTLPGYSRSGAFAINNRGQVFGSLSCPPADPVCGTGLPDKLVRWDRVGGSWTITPVDGCSVVKTLGDNADRFVINNNEQCARTAPDWRHVLVQTLSGGAVVNQQTLPSLYSDGLSRANAISDLVMVAGFSSEVLEQTGESSFRTGPPQPVVWYRRSTGVWVILQLGFPSTDLRASATDISGPDATGRVWVTGYTEYSGGSRRTSSTRAIRWSLQPDGLGGWQVASTDVLGEVGQGGPTENVWAGAVSQAGDVVGVAGAYLTDGYPVKWSAFESAFQQLPLAPGGARGRAMDINNLGWIAGAVWDEANKCDRAAIWRLRGVD